MPGPNRRGRAFLNHVIWGGGKASTSQSIVTGLFSTTVMFSISAPPMFGGTKSKQA